jgi:hypothetical protein
MQVAAGGEGRKQRNEGKRKDNSGNIKGILLEYCISLQSIRDRLSDPRYETRAGFGFSVVPIND